MRLLSRRLGHSYRRIREAIVGESDDILHRMETLQQDADDDFDDIHRENKREDKLEAHKAQATMWSKSARDAADAEGRCKTISLPEGLKHADYQKFMSNAWMNKLETPTYRLVRGVGALPTPDDRVQPVNPLSEIVEHDPDWLGQWGHGAC